MRKIVGITNQKGGVGKTTTAVNLAACLSAAKYKTLLVDIDPQSNATSGVGIDRYSIPKSIYSCLIEDTPISEVISPTSFEKLSILPANMDLVGAEVELNSAVSRETRLKEILALIADDYDVIVVDAPPSLGLLTANVLTAVDSVIIPVQCEYYALEGLSSLIETIEYVQKSYNSDLIIEGILITMFDSRTNLSKQVTDEIKKYFGNKVFDTIIPRSVRLSEAPSFGKPIIYYDFSSAGSVAYANFTKEVIDRLAVLDLDSPTPEKPETPINQENTDIQDKNNKASDKVKDDMKEERVDFRSQESENSGY